MNRELQTNERLELEKASSRATTALVVGILAYTPLGLFGIMAIIAVVQGTKARRVFREFPEYATLYGAGRAKAGFVLGLISLILGTIILIILIIALSFADTSN